MTETRNSPPDVSDASFAALVTLKAERNALLAQSAEYRAQRDALAAALSNLLPHAAGHAVDKDGYRAVRKARAALALVEKGA